MHRVKVYNAVDRLRIRNDVEWLNVAALVVCYADDSPALDEIEMYAVNRIGEITFIDFVSTL